MSTTKPIKVTDLSGPALDWAVAKCEGVKIDRFPEAPRSLFYGPCFAKYKPSSDWSLAGPIIEREKIDTLAHLIHGQWVAVYVVTGEEPWEFRGPTPLIAAMRCYVASRLGDTVEIPEGLI